MANLDRFPNIFVATLAQSLALGGSETSVYLSTITTLDGQPMQDGDFDFLGRAVLSVDVQSAQRAEFISFTGIDPILKTCTGAVRGLSYNSDVVIQNNKKFHAVGAPVIIAFGTHNLRDIERKISQAGGSVTVVDTNSSSSGSTAVSSITYDLTTSGTNRGILVQIETQEDVTVSGVTYDGNALTRIVQDTDAPNNLRNEQWFLVNPPIGTFDVVVTLSGAAKLTSGAEALATVNQITPIGEFDSDNGSSTNPTLTTTTKSTGSAVFDSLCMNSGVDIVATPGTNQDLNWQVVSEDDDRQGSSSVKQAGIAPDAVTSEYNLSVSTPWVMTSVEIQSAFADQFVKVSPADTTEGFLEDKIDLTSVDNSVIITRSILNPGGDEQLIFNLEAVAGAIGGGGGTKIAISTTEVTVGNTAVETTLFTIPIPADTLGTNDAIRFYAILRNAGMVNTNGETLTLRVKYGATTVASVVINDPETQFTGIGGNFLGYIVADGATNAQKAAAQVALTNNYGETITDTEVGITKMQGFAYGTGAVDSTSIQNLVLTAQWSTADVVNTITAEALVVEKISEGSNESKKVGVGEISDINWFNTQIKFNETNGGTSIWSISNLSSPYEVPIGTGDEWYLNNEFNNILPTSTKQHIFSIVAESDGFAVNAHECGIGFNVNNTSVMCETQGSNNISMGFVRSDTGQWYARAGTASGFTETAITVTDDVLTTFRCEYDPANATPQARYYIDGILVATITTNIPTIASGVVTGFALGNRSGGTTGLVRVFCPSFAVEI